MRLGDAKGPSAVEYRLARASSLGARVLSEQIRSAFVPILYHVSLLTVMGKWFTRAATWVFVKEQVKQGAPLNQMLLLPDFVVQSSPVIPMAAKEHKSGQEALLGHVKQDLNLVASTFPSYGQRFHWSLLG